MAKVTHWNPLSDDVATFRLEAEPGERFPFYTAGQNIQLCRGEEELLYSIVSAPHETAVHHYLEFFVNRDRQLSDGEKLTFAAGATGDFTLNRAQGFPNVLFVGTGTGIAPFISMIRYLNHEKTSRVRYTLIQASRKFQELGYYKELSAVESQGNLDFLYVPAVSRPSDGDWQLGTLAKGRAGNLLRELLNLPRSGDAVLPASLKTKDLSERLDPERTIILACGSHASVSDIRDVATRKMIRFVKEDW
jgi:ferredoxin-NADP reductase